MIKFVSFKEKTVLKNPLNSFKEESQTIEYRQDPLIGTWSRINTSRAKRVHQSQSKNDSMIDVAKKCDSCFFCKENVNKKTPEFPKKLRIGKRLKVGSAVIFPNLYPFAKYHAVCVLGENHGATLDAISEKNWEDALLGSIKYIKAVYKSDKTAKFASVNMNYMPPAAASIIHPHLQIVCDSKPGFYQNVVYMKCKEHYERTGKIYYEEIAKTDKKRLIIQGNNSVWLATYSPVLANEVTGIFLKKSSFSELSNIDIKVMAKEIARIFKALWKDGARSANMSIFSSPLSEKRKDFLLHARIGTRPEMKANYSADKGFMEVFHMEPVISTIPEDVAKKMKKLVQRRK